MMIKKTVLTLMLTSFLVACGGEETDCGGNNNNPVENNNATENASVNAGFNSVKSGTNDLFPNCLEALGSKDPTYLSCLSGEYKGVNLAGKACTVKFNGDTKDIDFRLGSDIYKIAGSEFDWSLFSKNIYNGRLDTLIAYANYYNNNQLKLEYTGGSSIKAELTYGDVKSSCIISEYKLNK